MARFPMRRVLVAAAQFTCCAYSFGFGWGIADDVWICRERYGSIYMHWNVKLE